jgi:hypothetical protein
MACACTRAEQVEHEQHGPSTALGMGGATVEGMGALRQALEFAGYAALVHGDHRLAHFWWDRDQSADAEKNVRRARSHMAPCARPAIPRQPEYRAAS